jgi:hypothetical protein
MCPQRGPPIAENTLPTHRMHTSTSKRVGGEHGHDHGHGLFILATYYEGKWTSPPVTDTVIQ